MLADVALEVSEGRAGDRIGEELEVLIESNEDGMAIGRAKHQAPETDGAVILDTALPIGSIVRATAVDAEGIDLVAEVTE